ncbi:O-antigen ligase family protein [Kineococcus sp. NUM-3379]
MPATPARTARPVAGASPAAAAPRTWALPGAVLLLAFAVPGNMVLPGPLRSNGSPSRLLALGCFVLAVLALLAHRERTRAEREVVRVPVPAAGLLVHVAVAVLLYGVAMLAPLGAAQSAGALRALLGTLGTAGLGFLVWALVRDRADRDRVLACIVAGACLSALVAVGTMAGLPRWADLAQSAGLVENTRTLREVSRGDLVRARGSAEHPIEYSLGLAAALPVALYLARHAVLARRRHLAALGCAVIVAGLPLAVSRTGLLGLAVALLVAVSSWSLADRAKALAATLLASAVAVLALPRLVQTLVDVFARAQEDNSVTGRLEDYPLVLEMVREHPWLGVGYGTYRPETGGVFLDNMWLGALVGGGVLGIAGLAVLFLLPMASAWDRSVLAPDQADRDLNRALLATLAVMLVGSVTSDLTSFQQPTMVLVAVIGLLAAAPAAAVVPAQRGRGRPAR